MRRPPPISTLFPYTTLFRSWPSRTGTKKMVTASVPPRTRTRAMMAESDVDRLRSEEHTSELQSRGHLVCRLLLEKKNQSNCILIHVSKEYGSNHLSMTSSTS